MMFWTRGRPKLTGQGSPWRNVRLGVAALVSVLMLGSVAYMVLGLDPFEALYQTLITVTTVGFAEIGDDIGIEYRVVTSLLIVGGVGVALYTIGAAFEAIIEGRIAEQLGRTRMQKVLDRMEGHIIVCGWGQVGRAIGRALRSQGEDVVIIDQSEDIIQLAGFPALAGDATDDRVLRRAGIERARGLVIALDSDADCTYVTLSGRSMNPDLFIVTRANGPTAEPKLRQAGADKVVNPHEIGGARMAAFMTQPNVADFLGEAMHDEQLAVELHEVVVTERSALDGITLDESRLVAETGVTVLAIRRADGTFDHHPSAATRVSAGDVPIVLGTAEQLQTLRVWIAGR